MDNKILTNVLRVISIFLAICAGWGFWMYLNEGVAIVIPFILGYIFMVIELARLKKWAIQFFIFILSLVLIIEVLFIALGGIKEGWLELFQILNVIVSSIGIIVLGISTLVRKSIKKA